MKNKECEWSSNTFSDVNSNDANMYSASVLKKNEQGQNVFLLKVLSIKMDECCYNIKVKQTNSFHFLALYVYIK